LTFFVFGVGRLFSTTLSNIAFRLAAGSMVVAYAAIVKTRLAKEPLTLSAASFRRFVALDEAPFVVLGLFALTYAAPSCFYIVPGAVFALCQLMPRFNLPPGGVMGLSQEKLLQAREQLARVQPAITQSMAQFEVTAALMMLFQCVIGATSLVEPLVYAKFYLAPRYRKSVEVAAYLNQLSSTVDGYAARFAIVARIWGVLKTFAARL